LAIFNHLPSFRQITPVYAVCVIMIYTWTTLWFFWSLPSWLFYLNLGEVIVLYAYISVINLLESLLVLCVPLGLSVVLPQKWFRDSFVSRGASLVILGLGYAMFLALQLRTSEAYPGALLKVWSIALAVGAIFLLVFMAGKTPLVKKVIEVIAQQATILLFVYLPISLISLFIVLPRVL